MQTARYLVALSCAYASAACGTEVAQAIYARGDDAGAPTPPEKPPRAPPRKSPIASRMAASALRNPCATSARGISSDCPQDDRIALSSSTNKVSFVAWVNSAGTRVRVTPIQLAPLAMEAGMMRAGDDYEVEGTELSGLVALDDGFALLTRRPDLGDPIGDGVTQAQATYFVRWQNGRELFAASADRHQEHCHPDGTTSEKRDFPDRVIGAARFQRISLWCVLHRPRRAERPLRDR